MATLHPDGTPNIDADRYYERNPKNQHPKKVKTPCVKCGGEAGGLVAIAGLAVRAHGDQPFCSDGCAQDWAMDQP